MARLIIIAFLFTQLFQENLVWGSDITNPVFSYGSLQKKPDGTQDSLLVGKMYFESMPEYMQKSQITLEYYLNFDSEAGLRFWFNEAFDGTVELDEYSFLVPGSFKAKDTVRATFTIMPRSIGILNLGFFVSDEGDYSSTTPRKNRCVFRTNIIISPDGKTFGIGSPVVDWRNASFLGVSPSLFDRGIYLSINPKQRNPRTVRLLAKISENRNSPMRLSMETEILPAPDNVHEFIVSCNASTSHSGLSPGIGFSVTHSDNLGVGEISPSYVGIVDSSMNLNFSVRIKPLEYGLGRLSLQFHAPNTGFADNTRLRKDGSIHEYTPKWTKFALQLYLGIDHNNQVIFITDQNPPALLKGRLSAKLQSNVEVDSRFDFVAALIPTLTSEEPLLLNKYSPRFEEILTIPKRTTNNEENR